MSDWSLTWLDSNSWLIEIGERRILLDPWLVGPLVFGGMPWLFRGERPSPLPLPKDLDLIVLSQGLEDHAHPETLRSLDPLTPVVTSPYAVPLLTEIGFTQITPLPHGAVYQAEGIQIRSLPGAPVGPMRTENAYLLTETTTGRTLYYEPHGYPSPQLHPFSPIDVVISPMVEMKIPVLGTIIRGTQGSLDLARWVKPQVMIPTAAPGDATYYGWLAGILKMTGGSDQLRQHLKAEGIPTRILDPVPGKRFTLDLSSPTLAIP